MEPIIVYYLLHHIFFMVLESNSLWAKSLRAAVNSVKDSQSANVMLYFGFPTGNPI